MKNTVKKLERIAKKLREAQAIADGIELTLSNGGIVGSIIGSTADEVEALTALRTTHPLDELPVAARKMWS